MNVSLNSSYAAWRANPSRGTETCVWNLVTEMARRIARRHLRGDAARDAAQDAVLRVFLSLDRFKGGSFKGHAYRAATWAVRDAYRRHHWQQARFEVCETEGDLPAASVPEPSARLDAARLLSRLSASHREVLEAIYLREERRADVARRAGRAPSVIHRRCERALNAARNAHA